MKRFLFSFMCVYLFVNTPIHSAIYKGQKVFVRECTQCHDTGQSFVAKKTMYRWKKLMKKKGFLLKKIHLKSKKTKKARKYFASNKYTRKAKHLKDFLLEYAKDSGNVPACH